MILLIETLACMPSVGICEIGENMRLFAAQYKEIEELFCFD